MSEGHTALRSVLEKREPVLAYLVDSAATKPELVEELSVSRSTVDRAVRDLIDAGCVSRENGTYTATTTGNLALAEYRQYKERTGAISRANELLNCLSEDAEIDPAILQGASVTVSEPHAPDRALAHSAEILAETTQLKGLAPVVLKSFLFTLDEELSRDEFTAEIVADPDVRSTLSDFPGAPTESILNDDSFILYEAQTSLPYALWIMETPTTTHTGITVYESGGVVGLITNTDDDAVQWARDQYRTYREEATPVSSP